MKKIQDIIIKAGYKITAPRLRILEKLKQEHDPVSARNLHKKLENINLASIYRALNLFEELRLVNVELLDKEKLYCISGEPHHHIVCQKCGHMEEIACTHSFHNIKNFSNIHHQLTLSGLCNKCSK